MLDLGILWCLQGYSDVSAYGALWGWPVADAALCSCAPKEYGAASGVVTGSGI